MIKIFITFIFRRHKFPITEGNQTQAVKEAVEKTQALDIIGLNGI